ncbi:helix-turn-helix domain-containing protein [Leifsonia aquatica]|uniref:DNA-binding helix-turn-helix protein n=2 Tax=Leifsonia aquatica TaxID=144185 RepID=U2T6Y4_LEIAQ|nr:helix-turn-helix transcriptional regulator [Leifsonia aquatica]ERK73248.1 DNA-binding helix-turn-helix protein [Leifsonia aquatica ATCC 14665]MBB2967509.1 transcriptional regulator with XRE-family HTH domain [Leifsonia aquatica]
MARTALTDDERAVGVRLGEALRQRRGIAQLSREGVARDAHISVETLRKAEQGHSPAISFLVLHRICRTLGLSLDALAQTLTEPVEDID